MARRKKCNCIYERKGHLEGQGDCPYGPHAKKLHPDGVIRGNTGKRNPAPKRVVIRNAKSVTITKLPNGQTAVRVVRKKR